MFSIYLECIFSVRCRGLQKGQGEWAPGVGATKTYYFVIDVGTKQAKVFVLGKHLKKIVEFSYNNKAGCYNFGTLRSLLDNTRLKILTKGRFYQT